MRTRRLLVAASLVVFSSQVTAAVAAQVPAPPERPPTAEEAERAQRIVDETLALAPEQPPSPDDVFADVVDAEALAGEAALARLVAAEASTKAHLVAFEAAVELESAREVADRAANVLENAKETLAEERDRLSQLTVRAFVTGGDAEGESFGALVNGDTTDPAHGRAVIFEQVLQRQEEVTDEARKRTNNSRKRLVRAREHRSVASVAATATAEAARVRAQAQTDAEQAHEKALLAIATATNRLRSGLAGGVVPQEVAIIGLPRLRASDLASWFAASSYRPRVTTPIEDYAAWFIEEGAAEGIRGDIAFAQAVLETGGFANTDSVFANNFSGIGHCDLCPSGWVFPSPQMGVRAQMQLLKSYAIKKPEYVNDLVDRRLRGPAGCCETWGDLTTVWATDPTYGPKVMFIYSSMVSHALARRAAGLGFDDAEPAPSSTPAR